MFSTIKNYVLCCKDVVMFVIYSKGIIVFSVLHMYM